MHYSVSGQKLEIIFAYFAAADGELLFAEARA